MITRSDHSESKKSVGKVKILYPKVMLCSNGQLEFLLIANLETLREDQQQKTEGARAVNVISESDQDKPVCGAGGKYSWGPAVKEEDRKYHTGNITRKKDVDQNTLFIFNMRT